ncbi:hypothetical protein Q5H92_22880 [Hymenobacter sp. M29]|uniref:Uncharacterized protein n=1 Tax=Hymenobacter mellowenesis TaxID=3063995 RepID=A0ABT9AIM0_9BACT|nr:hypothetical protein [Hymenobacter sp. M29]MDO7849227.1 hypothetical protein [Hymenobacter sp. M29]
MTVKEWLDSERDYEAGRQLYAALGDNDRLKRLFADGPTRYNREAVAWELTKLARAGSGQLSVISYQLAVISIDASAAEKDTSSEPESSPNATFSLQKDTSSAEKGTELLDELKAEQRGLYDERAGVHAQLEGAKDEEERRLMAVRVMTLSRQLNTNWETYHYVEAHGELPPAPAPAPGLDQLAPADLVKKRNNLRSQASKLKKQPHRADDLLRVEAELAQVEQLLNPTNGQ